MRAFASDNQAGVHPKVFRFLEQANAGHAKSYGGDTYSSQVASRLCAEFGARDCFFVFNGTGGNVTALKSLTRSYEAVVCSAFAHINVDECAAPEITGGFKLLTCATEDGKLTPDAIGHHLVRRGDEHHVQVRGVSISQPTELGTVYSLDELKALSTYCQSNKLFLHVDGARLFNAAAELGCELIELGRNAGIDVLTLGGTKNAMMFGEAVLFFSSEGKDGFRYFRKQATQLYSKTRFIAAQFDALLDGSLWLENARSANAMAERLYQGASRLEFVKITQVRQANAVFALLPREVMKRARDKYFFYEWDEKRGEVRWMTSFDTTTDDVDGLIAELKRAWDEVADSSQSRRTVG